MSQRVLVTAAASGIGLEIARAFSAGGAQVFVTDINTQALEKAKKEIPDLLTFVCDNSKRADIEAMVPAAVNALGGLDVLVNNAGISGPTAPVEEIDPDKWEAVMTVMKPRRKAFASGDWFKGTPEEYGQEATTYIAYCGPFHVDEEKKTLTHSMFVSLFPNWLGQTQPRNVKIENNTLHLSTVSPIHSGGKIVNSYLQWKRAEPG